MQTPEEERKLAASEILEKVVNRYSTDEVSIGEIMQSLHERGFALFMMIMVLPNCVPIPVPPGTSTVLSIPLLFLSIQMLIGYPSPWLPRWLRDRKLKRSTWALMVSKIAPRLRKVERILRRRWEFTETPTGEKIVGFFWLLFAISIAIPLPMTNFLPGVGILLISLGMLGRDGIVAVIGVLVGCVGLIVTSIVLWTLFTVGMAGVNRLSQDIPL